MTSPGEYKNIRPSKIVFYKYFLNFLQTLKPGKKVLDIASANFKNAHLFQGFTYVGADIEEAKIQEGKNRYPEDAFSGVACDMRQLPFADETFDYVVSTHSLSHLKSESDILSSIAGFVRTLKKDGVLFFNIPLKDSQLETKVDNLLKNQAVLLEKKKYRGNLSALWESLFVKPFHLKCGKSHFWKNLMLNLASFFSLLDFIGIKSRAIYVCSR